MIRTTTITPVKMPDPDAVAKLAEQGYSLDSLKTAIEQSQKLAGDPKASAEEAASAKVVIDKLASLIPTEIDHDHTDVKIAYEEKDRVVVGLHGGQVGATLITKDGGGWLAELDSAPGITLKLTESAFVPQATTEGDGQIEYRNPVRYGWLKPPARTEALKVGTNLRCCPLCQSVLMDGDESAKKCSDCGKTISAIYRVGLEAL